jgi:hypothetical protein
MGGQIMELIIGLFLMFGGIGLAVNEDAKKRVDVYSSDKQVRLIQQTREVQYSQKVLHDWEYRGDSRGLKQ